MGCHLDRLLVIKQLVLPGHLLSKLYCDELLTVLLLLGCPSYVCLLSLDQIEVGFVGIREISRDKSGFVSILQSVACVSYHPPTN